jgi:hypothetical protein
VRTQVSTQPDTVYVGAACDTGSAPCDNGAVNGVFGDLLSVFNLPTSGFAQVYYTDFRNVQLQDGSNTTVHVIRVANQVAGPDLGTPRTLPLVGNCSTSTSTTTGTGNLLNGLTAAAAAATNGIGSLVSTLGGVASSGLSSATSAAAAVTTLGASATAAGGAALTTGILPPPAACVIPNSPPAIPTQYAGSCDDVPWLYQFTVLGETPAVTNVVTIPPGAQRVLLAIHGYIGSALYMGNIAGAIQSFHGNCSGSPYYDVVLSYSYNSFTCTIESAAAALVQLVNTTVPGNVQLDVVTHSLGGGIGRYALQVLGLNSRVTNVYLMASVVYCIPNIIALEIAASTQDLFPLCPTSDITSQFLQENAACMVGNATERFGPYLVANAPSGAFASTLRYFAMAGNSTSADLNGLLLAEGAIIGAQYAALGDGQSDGILSSNSELGLGVLEFQSTFTANTPLARLVVEEDHLTIVGLSLTSIEATPTLLPIPVPADVVAGLKTWLSLAFASCPPANNGSGGASPSAVSTALAGIVSAISTVTSGGASITSTLGGAGSGAATSAALASTVGSAISTAAAAAITTATAAASSGLGTTTGGGGGTPVQCTIPVGFVPPAPTSLAFNCSAQPWLFQFINNYTALSSTLSISPSATRLLVLVHGHSGSPLDWVGVAQVFGGLINSCTNASYYDAILAYEYNSFFCTIPQMASTLVTLLVNNSAIPAGARFDVGGHSLGGPMWRQAIEIDGLGSRVDNFYSFAGNHYCVPNLIAESLVVYFASPAAVFAPTDGLCLQAFSPVWWNVDNGNCVVGNASDFSSPFFQTLNAQGSPYASTIKYFTMAGTVFSNPPNGWPASAGLEIQLLYTADGLGPSDGVVAAISARGEDILESKSDFYGSYATSFSYPNEVAVNVPYDHITMVGISLTGDLLDVAAGTVPSDVVSNITNWVGLAFPECPPIAPPTPPSSTLSTLLAAAASALSLATSGAAGITTSIGSGTSGALASTLGAAVTSAAGAALTSAAAAATTGLITTTGGGPGNPNECSVPTTFIPPAPTSSVFNCTAAPWLFQVVDNFTALSSTPSIPANASRILILAHGYASSALDVLPVASVFGSLVSSCTGRSYYDAILAYQYNTIFCTGEQMALALALLVNQTIPAGARIDCGGHSLGNPILRGWMKLYGGGARVDNYYGFNGDHYCVPPLVAENIILTAAATNPTCLQALSPVAQSEVVCAGSGNATDNPSPILQQLNAPGSPFAATIKYFTMAGTVFSSPPNGWPVTAGLTDQLVYDSLGLGPCDGLIADISAWGVDLLESESDFYAAYAANYSYIGFPGFDPANPNPVAIGVPYDHIVGLGLTATNLIINILPGTVPPDVASNISNWVALSFPECPPLATPPTGPATGIIATVTAAAASATQTAGALVTAVGTNAAASSLVNAVTNQAASVTRSAATVTSAAAGGASSLGGAASSVTSAEASIARAASNLAATLGGIPNPLPLSSLTSVAAAATHSATTAANSASNLAASVTGADLTTAASSVSGAATSATTAAASLTTAASSATTQAAAVVTTATGAATTAAGNNVASTLNAATSATSLAAAVTTAASAATTAASNAVSMAGALASSATNAAGNAVSGIVASVTAAAASATRIAASVTGNALPTGGGGAALTSAAAAASNAAAALTTSVAAGPSVTTLEAAASTLGAEVTTLGNAAGSSLTSARAAVSTAAAAAASTALGAAEAAVSAVTSAAAAESTAATGASATRAAASVTRAAASLSSTNAASTTASVTTGPGNTPGCQNSNNPNFTQCPSNSSSGAATTCLIYQFDVPVLVHSLAFEANTSLLSFVEFYSSMGDLLDVEPAQQPFVNANISDVLTMRICFYQSQGGVAWIAYLFPGEGDCGDNDGDDLWWVLLTVLLVLFCCCILLLNGPALAALARRRRRQQPDYILLPTSAAPPPPPQQPPPPQAAPPAASAIGGSVLVGGNSYHRRSGLGLQL